MFTLLETVIGFTVIMLLLSYLVKSLTSVVKNHFDYYSGHLETEVRDLVMRLLGKHLEDVKIGVYEPFKGIDWKEVGEEFLTADNFKALLGPALNPGQVEALEAQLEIHKGKMQYAFSRRMKNLSLVCGLALCLIVNINAFTIWQTLYNDGQTRAKFAAPDYVQAVIARADGAQEAAPETEEGAEEATESEAAGVETGAPEPPADATAGAGAGAADDGGEDGAGGDGPADVTEPAGTQGDPGAAGPADTTTPTKAELAEEREMFATELASFTSEVNFGVGRVYDKSRPLGPRGFLIELLGSLLTGILVSIGAPYWHDLLRTLSRVRSGAQPAGGG